MPLRKLTKKEYKTRFKPWITDNVLDKIDKKDRMFRKYMRCKDPTIKQTLNTEFKSLKNEITSLTR